MTYKGFDKWQWSDIYTDIGSDMFSEGLTAFAKDLPFTAQQEHTFKVRTQVRRIHRYVGQ